MPRAGEGSAYQRELLDSLIAQTRALRESVQFVLWPEGVLLEPLGDRPDLLREIQALVDERGLQLILGGARRVARQRHVSALLLRPGRDAAAIYDKQRLVPFAEAWPDWAPRPLRGRLGRLVPVRPASPGTPRSLPFPFELSLCWESAFSTRAGRAAADLLVSLVNDGWYDDTPAAAQTLLLSRWRAIERGAWLMRVATTGVSAVVSPEGRVVARLGVGQSGVLLASLVSSSSETAFEQAGYRPLCFACLSLVAIAVWRRSEPTRPA